MNIAVIYGEALSKRYRRGAIRESTLSSDISAGASYYLHVMWQRGPFKDTF